MKKITLIPNFILNDNVYLLFKAYVSVVPNVTVIQCGGLMSHCESNPYGYKARCTLCNIRTNALSKIANQSVNANSFIDKDFEPTEDQHFSSVKNSVVGMLASYDKVSLEGRLKHKSKRVLPDLVKDALRFKNFLFCHTTEHAPEKIVVFNGRYPHSLSSFLISKDSNFSLEFEALELWGQKVPNVSKNRIIHDPAHVFENAKRAKNRVSPQQLDEIAEKYYNSRWKWGGGKMGEKNFIRNQSVTNFERFSDAKIRISLFPSSAYEYNFLPEGYYIVDQAKEIAQLINTLKGSMKDKVHLIIRLHPNLGNSPEPEIQPFLDLETMSGNGVIVEVISPKGNASTYQIMREASHVVTFASFAAVEANYLGKCVLQIGPSRYRDFNIAKQYSSGTAAAEDIATGFKKVHPKNGSKIFAAGFMIPPLEHQALMDQFLATRLKFTDKICSVLKILKFRFG